jgi:predicted Rdx family selenoprotein
VTRPSFDDVILQAAEIIGGTFDDLLDGKLIFSKKKVGRFPDVAEVLDKIPAA